MDPDLSVGENVPVLVIEQRAVGSALDQLGCCADKHRSYLCGGSLEGASVRSVEEDVICWGISLDERKALRNEK
jgi:hypothetical protein